MTQATPTAAAPQFGFSPTSGTGTSFELIPNSTLAFGIFTVKSVKLSAAGGNYIEGVITITDGPFEKRKVFTNIMDPLFAANSEGARQMGLQALTRCFEVSGLFKPEQPETYRAFDNKTIEDIAIQLDGSRVAFKIKIEKGSGGYSDKNAVAEYLSPNPASNGFRGWQQLTGAVPMPPAGIAKSPVTSHAAPGSSFATQRAAASIANGPGWLKDAVAGAPPVATPPAVVPPVAQPLPAVQSEPDPHQAAIEVAAETTV